MKRNPKSNIWGKYNLSLNTNPKSNIWSKCNQILKQILAQYGNGILDSQAAVSTCLTFGEEGCQRFQGEESQVVRKMQPGDLAPNFTGLACLASGQIEDFDSSTLNRLYTVLVFYEVIHLNHPSCPQKKTCNLVFRATSCQCLPASSEHLPPHSTARSVTSSPSPQTRSRCTGSSSAVCVLSYLIVSGSLLAPLWRSWASPWWRTRLGRSQGRLECLTRPHTPPSPLPSSWTTRGRWWPPSPPAPRLNPIWSIWSSGQTRWGALQMRLLGWWMLARSAMQTVPGPTRPRPLQ